MFSCVCNDYLVSEFMDYVFMFVNKFVDMCIR